jgi:hypothetical protein
MTRKAKKNGRLSKNFEFGSKLGTECCHEGRISIHHPRSENSVEIPGVLVPNTLNEFAQFDSNPQQSNGRFIDILNFVC